MAWSDDAEELKHIKNDVGPSLGLPYAQDRVISELAKVNKNLIVVNYRLKP